MLIVAFSYTREAWLRESKGITHANRLTQHLLSTAFHCCPSCTGGKCHAYIVLPLGGVGVEDRLNRLQQRVMEVPIGLPPRCLNPPLGGDNHCEKRAAGPLEAKPAGSQLVM
jgi:hypothetical protein